MSRKASSDRTFTVAVAGQPNAGKSTTFNALTGARQFVANYPGVTVEKRTGSFAHRGTRITLVDLPGTYSLTSYSLEERVARDFLLDERPAVVLNVVDAANLERNLYLTFQLLEMERPLIIALNMMDIAKGRGIEIDAEGLSAQLGVPVVPTVSNRGSGRHRLREVLWETCTQPSARRSSYRVDYGEGLEPAIEELERSIQAEADLVTQYPSRWLAVKLLEGDPEVQQLLKGTTTARDYRLSES